MTRDNQVPITSSIRRIVWAIDALGGLDLLQTNIPKVIQTLATVARAEVTPIYVLGPLAVLGGSRMSRDEFRVLERKAQQAMDRELARVVFPGMRSPMVFVERVFKIRECARALSRIAEGERADLIVAGTHARTGVKRAILGSFAEALLLDSRIPVLAMQPRVRVIDKVSQILFPTDFAEHAERIFDEVIALANELKAEITVLHCAHTPTDMPVRKAPIPFEHVKDSAPFAWVEEWRQQLRQLGDYERRARKSGIRAEAFLDLTGLPPHCVILEFAEQNRAQLIAMPARSGPIMSILNGATTKNVIRNAAYPVWVLHERGVTRAKAAA